MTVAPDPVPDDPTATSTRRFADEAEAELRAIEAALGRLDDGTYGRCVVCGAEIEPDRLEARPSERHCATHAETSRPGES